MRILDENNVEITSPDLSLGYLVPDKVFIAHHDAIEAVEEVGHYEVIAEYPNGGKDVVKVIDINGVEAQEAWDEYEDILRYVRYTDEELSEREQTAPSQLDIIEAQVVYTAMMTGTLLEV
jgi:hypothetical protein